jgi:flagellar FliJ protein
MDNKKLARLHRVRTLQLGMARAAETRAQEQVASEAALSNRIAQLAAAVAPGEGAGAAVSFAAMAHYREKLHRNAQAVDNRVRAAEAEATRALEARQSAKRDQTAVEKLIARGEAEAALRAIRALQEAPPTRKIRHDPC